MLPQDNIAFIRYARTKECGIFINGELVHGTVFNDFGIKVYQGFLHGNEFHGIGITFYPNGEISYQGPFRNGLRHGKGATFNINGELELGAYYDESNRLVPFGQFIDGFYNFDSLFADIVHGPHTQESIRILNLLPPLLFEHFILHVYKKSRSQKFKRWIDLHFKRYYKEDGIDCFSMIQEPRRGLQVSFGLGFKKSGKGFYLYYTGDWQENQKSGYGIIYSRSQHSLYEGYFEGNKFNGYGKISDKHGNAIYAGYLLDGLMDGHGILYYPMTGNIFFEGHFRKGKRHGHGIEFKDNKERNVSQAGFYIDGVYTSGWIQGQRRFFQDHTNHNNEQVNAPQDIG